VAGSCEFGDERSGSCATELVSYLWNIIILFTTCTRKVCVVFPTAFTSLVLCCE
jgi:hypothetical protein